MTIIREDTDCGSYQTQPPCNGVAAVAIAAAPHVFAQQVDQRGFFKFYEKGNVRIRYQEVGNGFPFLVTPGGA